MLLSSDCECAATDATIQDTQSCRDWVTAADAADAAAAAASCAAAAADSDDDDAAAYSSQRAHGAIASVWTEIEAHSCGGSVLVCWWTCCRCSMHSLVSVAASTPSAATHMVPQCTKTGGGDSMNEYALPVPAAAAAVAPPARDADASPPLPFSCCSSCSSTQRGDSSPACSAVSSSACCCWAALSTEERREVAVEEGDEASAAAL
jgi:hypothetical protein